MAGVLRDQRRESERHRGEETLGPLGLIVLLVGGAVLGIVLWEIDGGPRVPDWAHVREVLAGSELADADVIAAAATVAWLVLGYLALIVGLRLPLLLADRLSGGARWARTGLQLSNLITIPAVRRLVDGGVAGTLLVSSWLPQPTRIAAAADPVAIVALAPPPREAWADSPQWRTETSPQQESPQFVEYTVADGDYLWDIARRFYGDGSRFVEIFDANRGRVMLGGEAFTDPRLIRPGWVLQVPLPAQNMSVEDGIVSYRVRRGDHLWGIAERFLSDGFRWVEIWELNGGREMEAGRRFTDPNLIYPGWLLELRLQTGEPAAPAETLIPPAPAVTPVASSPTETPATASPDPVETIGTETADDTTGGGWDWEWPSLPRPVVVTAAGFAVIGGTALFVQRLRRAGALQLRRGLDPRGSDPGDAGRVALATRALAEALTDYGFADSRPLLVLEAGRRLEFTVACPAGDAEALLALRHDLARRLACDVEGELIGLTRVALTLTGFRRLAGLLAGESSASPALVVPVGADADGIVYLNIAAVGSVIVAGTDGERRQLLRSWLATLSTTCSPEELSFRMESGAARLLEADAGLPHFAGAAGERDATDLADELDEIVESRGSGGNVRHGHPIVAIFDLANAGGELPGQLLQDGPPVEVFVISCVPPSKARDHLGASGASIAFGGAGDGTDGDDDGTPPGAIVLSIGRDQPLTLEPVHVRRDTSPRWSESAEVDALSGPFDQAPGDASHPPEEVARTFNEELSPDGTVGEGDSPPLSPPPKDPLPELVAGDDGATIQPPATAGREAEPSPTEAAGAEDRREMPAAEAAQAQSAGPIEPATEDAEPERIEVTPSEEIREAPSEPEPVAPASSNRSLGAIRQAALLTHDDLPAAEGGAAAGAQTVFVVRCLGRLEVWLGATPIERWPLEKSRELLAFLATQGGAAVPRESVAEAMWPEYPWDASLRHLIANAVSSLRRVLRSAAGDDELQPVVTARQRYQLQTALFRIDLDAFESSLRRAAGLPDVDALEEYERATALYRGDFLEGELFPWIDAYRADYRQRLVEGASRGAAIAERLGEHQRAEWLYQVILEQEPTDEEAARGRMRHLAAAGDINGARKVLKALTESLQQELDDPRASPASETKALLAELLAEEEGGVA